jgi:hypothetical protein
MMECSTTATAATAADASPSPSGRLDELDRRQDDVLARLDELNSRVTGLLDQFTLHVL